MARPFLMTSLMISGSHLLTKLDKQINQQAQQTLADGRQIFRFDTFF
jgi:hypothetical protein